MAGSAQKPGVIIEGINVTPLVDIVLVLLIIFIVTAKFVVAPAVPLDLPRATQSEEVQTILAVSITADGKLLIDGQPGSHAQLGERAKAALQKDEALRAVIQADGNALHKNVIAVLDTLKANGVERVAFGTVRPEVGSEAGTDDGSRSASEANPEAGAKSELGAAKDGNASPAGPPIE
ncbi:MAG: biopolymer transporter ExbD [Myxococcota bacterium]